MDERPAIVIFNLERWGQPWWKDREFFMRELALRGWDILWTQGPVSLWNRGSDEWKNSPYWGNIEPHAVAPGVEVWLDTAGRIAPIWPRHHAWNAITIRLWAARIKSWVRSRGHTRWIALITYPSFDTLLPVLRPTWRAFHIFDDWSQNLGWEANGRDAAHRLARQSNLVTSISSTMLGVVPENQKGRVKILPHACDLDTFLPPPGGFPEPKELSSIPHPRVGYFGRISAKNDLPLMRQLAQKTPSYQWIFVGKVGDGQREGEFRPNSQEQSDWESLCSQPNVHHFAERDRQHLPALLNNMDVNIMCYKLDEEGYWSGGFPLKLFEYLACGRPIVATGLASLKPYESVLRLASDANSWLHQLHEALLADTKNDVENRLEVAKANTWSVRGDLLDNWLLSMVYER